MNQACVSLEEVFAAATARAASLVPETSGYLALAVADATSRLPYVQDDRAVLLTVDGSVMVPKKGVITAPPEAARGLRDLLRRLLDASTGSMPGLTSAARPRAEEHDVDRVVTDIEAALIPVNRAAAKRALARLARETMRAKEAGKLRKKPSQVPAPAPAPRAEAAPAPRAALPAPPAAPGIAPPVPAASAYIQNTSRAPAPRAAATPAPRPALAPPPLVVAPPSPSPPPIEIDVDVSAAPTTALEASGAPHPWEDNDATVADPEAMAVIEAAYREIVTPGQGSAVASSPVPRIAAEKLNDTGDDALTRPWHPVVENVEPLHTPAASAAPAVLVNELGGSRADELLDAFRPRDQGEPALAAAASSLLALAGVEVTPSQPAPPRPPLRSAPPLPPPRRSAPATAGRDPLDDDLLPPSTRAQPSPRGRWPLAVFAVGVLVLFAAWLYRPTLARDFWGLRFPWSPPATPRTDTAPAAAPIPPAPAVHARPRDARADHAADGQHRRRE